MRSDAPLTIINRPLVNRVLCNYSPAASMTTRMHSTRQLTNCPGRIASKVDASKSWAAGAQLLVISFTLGRPEDGSVASTLIYVSILCN